MKELTFATASALAAAIAQRQVSSIEVVDFYLSRIERYNPSLNAIATLDAEGARRRANEADQALARGERWGPLHGVPVALKDCFATRGIRTTAGFPLLSEYVPDEDGALAARLRGAGAVLLGKTNMSMLGLGSQTQNPIFGRTNNPWNLDRTPGGSSGGSASAVAAGLTPLDFGSDTTGSIRIPASFCGVYGLRPTARRVPQSGHIPPLPTTPRLDRWLTVSGPLARDVDDLTLGFQIIAGPDGRDHEVAAVPVSAPPALELADLRIAWSSAFPGVRVAAEIRGAIERFAAELERHGVHVEERSPDVGLAEQEALLLRFLSYFSHVAGQLFGFELGPPAQPPPTPGDMFVLLDQRDALCTAWERFLSGWDAFICPAVLVTAFPHGDAEAPLLVDGESVPYWMVDRHCFQFSLTGQPAVSMPLSRDTAGLPIGVQVVGKRWSDERLLGIVKQLAKIAGPIGRPPGF